MWKHRVLARWVTRAPKTLHVHIKAWLLPLDFLDNMSVLPFIKIQGLIPVLKMIRKKPQQMLKNRMALSFCAFPNILINSYFNYDAHLDPNQ